MRGDGLYFVGMLLSSSTDSFTEGAGDEVMWRVEGDAVLGLLDDDKDDDGEAVLGLWDGAGDAVSRDGEVEAVSREDGEEFLIGLGEEDSLGEGEGDDVRVRWGEEQGESICCHTDAAAWMNDRCVPAHASSCARNALRTQRHAHATQRSAQHAMHITPYQRQLYYKYIYWYINDTLFL